MKEIIILGGIRYNDIDLNPLIDSFDRNMRCNMGLPNNNNGTKYDIQVVNIHVFQNFFRQLKPYSYLSQHYKYTKPEYLSSFYNAVKAKEFKGLVIQNPHIEKNLINSYLKSIRCPIMLTKPPRVGILGIYTALKNKIDNIYICGFGIDVKEEKQSYYNTITASSKYHEIDSEKLIIIWLHRNKYIDVSLCCIKTKNDIIEFDESIITCTEKMKERVRNYCFSK